MHDVNFIAVDFDGTLLRDDHSMGIKTIEVWRALLEKKMHIVPATGRPLVAVKNNIPSDLCSYIVCTNGVHVYEKRAQDWELLLETNLEWSDAESVFETQMKKFPKVHVHCYCGETLYSRAMTPELSEYQERAGLQAKFLRSWDELRGRSISKIMCVSSHKVLLELQSHYKDLSAQVTFSMPTYLEIFNNKASKSRAIEYVMKRVGTDPQHALAIGDAFNDEPMLKVCKYAYVMKNAPADLAPHLPRTQYTNNEDGVAFLLESLFFQKENGKSLSL